MISRRCLVTGAIGNLVTQPRPFTTRKDDAQLTAWGRRFLALAHQLDVLLKQPDSADPGSLKFNRLLNEIEPIEAEIQNTRAYTMAGLRIKAEMANWSREGNLQPSTLCLDERMAWSIVQDLMKSN